MSVFGAIGDVIQRDAGHAFNAGNNLLNYGSLHAPTTMPAGGYAPGTGPNSLGSQWINSAHADPSNPGAIFNLAAQQAQTNRPQGTNPAVKDATTTQTTPTNTPTNAPQTGGAGTGTGSPDYGAFKDLYDIQLGNLQNQYSALPAYQNEATHSILSQYTPQYNTLQTQHASGNANLDLAQNQLDTQRSQGIRNLGNSLRGALGGYQNQIGVMGAGNSSAAPMIGYALAQQGNRSTGDMNNQYNQQQSGLDLQRNDLGANFKNQMDTIDAWKDSNLNDIAARYSQQQQQMQQSIMGAQGDEARYLAMYGQTALANQTIAHMQQLEQQYRDQVGQLNNHFQQVHAAPADISQYTGQRAINPITPTQLAPLNFQNNQANTNDSFGAPSLTKRPDQNPNTNLGF